MSDCGVCVSGHDFDGEALEFSDRRIIKKSRKRAQCSECFRWMEVGSSYQMVCGKNGDDFWTFKTCLICAEIREAFSCDGEIFGGSFWESMEYCFEALNTSCFDKLKTPEAKNELRGRWMKWKGLAA